MQNSVHSEALVLLHSQRTRSLVCTPGQWICSFNFPVYEQKSLTKAVYEAAVLEFSTVKQKQSTSVHTMDLSCCC